MTAFRIRTLACVLLVVQFAAAQDSSGVSLSNPIGRDLSSFWSDAGYVLTAPLRFDGGEWATAGAIAGGTAIVSTADNAMRNFAQRNTSSDADHVFNIGNQYGDNLNVLIFCSGVYGGGLLFGSEHVRTTGRMMFESALFAGIYTTVIKSVAGRSRPYLEEGPYRFRPVQFDNDRLSLPSGHTTLAFAISTVLSRRLDNTYASVFVYSLASLTALARVYSDEHWFSDTMLGAAIGTAVGLTVTRSQSEERAGTSLRISPFAGGVRVDLIF